VSLDRRAPVYAALAAAGMLVGVAGSMPSAIALGAAFLIPLAYGLAAHRPLLPRVHVEVSRPRLLEGDDADIRIVVTASAAVDWLEVELPLPPRLRPVAGKPCRVISLPEAGERTLVYRLECAHWGAYTLGDVELTGRRALALVAASASAPGRIVRVYPRVERLRRVVAPLATRPASGNRPARESGDGIEFAETREYRAGDRVRRINWHASARRGQLLVSDRVPERSSDVVIFLDSLAQAQTLNASTLDFSVRAAAALVAAYLPRRDRVGLLAFGADLQWVLPSGGTRQQYRIVEATLASESARFYRWHDPRLIPRRVLPPQSLVVALTPLLDWRVIRALLNLRGRGFDLAVIEVDPVPFADEDRARYGDDAWRAWLLARDATRTRFRRAGCRIARWDREAPLTAVVEELAWTR
jgi:uncharacterized protein (DUF58 family)